MFTTSKKPPRVLALVPAMIPPPLIYGIKPLSSLAQNGKIILDSVAEAEVSPSQINWADMVIFCRNCEPLYDHNLQQILDRNIPFVYDLDDNYWDIDPESIDGQYLRSPHRLRQTERYIRYANIVRVFNPRLYQKVNQFTNNAFLVDPCIDLKLVPVKKFYQNDQIIRIVYVTTRGEEDPFLEIIATPMMEILTKNPEKVEATFWGGSGNRFSHLPNVRNLPLTPDYEQYIRILSRSGFDIGLAPINPDPFTLAKTNTKYRDYGACRIAGIYTNCEIYSTNIQHEQNGILVNNSPGAWRNAIEHLINDDMLRISISENAFEHVKVHFSQEKMEEKWLQHISDLLPQFDNFITENLETQHISLSQGLAPISLQVKVNLGKKFEVEENFYCFYNSTLPDIDIQYDIDFSIPIKTNSVDFLLADHVLNNSSNVLFLLQEIYRVCKHGAQICIVVPYHTYQLGLANPKLTTTFNEFTPWYWSEFQPSWLSLQGPENSYFWNTRISKKDFSTPPLDIRLVKIAFNYLADFRNNSQEEQEVARRKYLNVCDQIIYHLVVLKKTVTEDEVNNMTGRWQYYEPPNVTARRYKDLYEITSEKNKELKINLETRENELQEAQQKIEVMQNQTYLDHELIQENQKKIQYIQEENEQLRLLEEKYKHIFEELATNKAQSNQQKEKISEFETALEISNNLIETSRCEIEQLRKFHNTTLLKGITTARTLSNYRESRVMRLVRRMRDRTDARHDISPDFQQHLDDSGIFQPYIDNYLLQSSNNLQNLEYVEYSIIWNKPNLSEISLALIVDFPPTKGIIGIELVNPVNNIILHMRQDMVHLDFRMPVCFCFSPILETQTGQFLLRIFVQESDVPVRVFEWCKYTFFGFARIKKSAFCAFRFSV